MEPQVQAVQQDQREQQELVNQANHQELQDQAVLQELLVLVVQV